VPESLFRIAPTVSANTPLKGVKIGTSSCARIYSHCAPGLLPRGVKLRDADEARHIWHRNLLPASLSKRTHIRVDGPLCEELAHLAVIESGGNLP